MLESVSSKKVEILKKKIVQDLKLICDPLNFLLKIWDPLFFCPKIWDPLKTLQAGIP